MAAKCLHMPGIGHCHGPPAVPKIQWAVTSECRNETFMDESRERGGARGGGAAALGGAALVVRGAGGVARTTRAGGTCGLQPRALRLHLHEDWRQGPVEPLHRVRGPARGAAGRARPLAPAGRLWLSGMHACVQVARAALPVAAV
jgi:hypothetical protein